MAKIGRPPREVDVEPLVQDYSGGRSIQEIARGRGLSFTLVRSRLLSAGVKLRTPFEMNRRPVDTSSMQAAYVLGVYLGDGYAWRTSSNGHPGFKIGLSTVDREFADAFSLALARMGVHVPPYRRKKYPDRPAAKEAWVVEVCSFNLYHWLTSLDSAAIREVVNRPGRSAIAFLRGVYDSEGSLTVRGNGPDLRMGNADSGTMHLTKELMERLNLHPGLYSYEPRPGRKRMYHVVLSRRVEIRRFLSIVKPSIPRKSSAPGV